MERESQETSPHGQEGKGQTKKKKNGRAIKMARLYREGLLDEGQPIFLCWRSLGQGTGYASCNLQQVDTVELWENLATMAALIHQTET